MLGQAMDTGTDYGYCDSTIKVLHRWTLAINTITLASTGQLWPAPPGFTDVHKHPVQYVPEWDRFVSASVVYISMLCINHEITYCPLPADHPVTLTEVIKTISLFIRTSSLSWSSL